MSEALRKFITPKAKTRAAFDKKFGGEQGAISLMEMVGDAPKSVQKQARKLLDANPDDTEAFVRSIGDLLYGNGGGKTTGIRGKTDAPAEVIENNLPANDTGEVADPPAPKKKGKKDAAAAEPRGQTAAAAKKDAEAAQAAATDTTQSTDPEDDGLGFETEIGQFIPMDGMGGVMDTGPGLGRQIIDPRLEVTGRAPPASFSIDSLSGSIGDLPDMAEPNAPAPVEPKFNPFSITTASALDQSATPTMSRADAMNILGGLMEDPSNPATMQGPFRDGLFGMAGGGDMTPPADPALPGTITPDGGFLGLDQAPTQINNAGGFMDGLYGPTDQDAAIARSLASAEQDRLSRLKREAIGGAASRFNAQQAARRNAQPQPSSPSPPPAEAAIPAATQARQPREPLPPLANRTWGEFFGSPGVVSKANEFLYQRGLMPKGMAQTIAPVAKTIDVGGRIAGTAGATLAGVGIPAYGLSKAVQYMTGDPQAPAGAPPTDEEQAALEAKSAASMRQLQQILGGTTLRNPASAPPSKPVQ